MKTFPAQTTVLWSCEGRISKCSILSPATEKSGVHVGCHAPLLPRSYCRNELCVQGLVRRQIEHVASNVKTIRPRDASPARASRRFEVACAIASRYLRSLQWTAIPRAPFPGAVLEGPRADDHLRCHHRSQREPHGYPSVRVHAPCFEQWPEGPLWQLRRLRTEPCLAMNRTRR